MPPSDFSKFPAWDDPSYRRYWLKHNVSEETWNTYSGDDIWRGLASDGYYVSRNMLYDARKYVLGQPGRESAFASLDPEGGIPQNMYESEPYWKQTSDYLYTMRLSYVDEDGNTHVTMRAYGSDEPLTPFELEQAAADIWHNKKYPDAFDFDTLEIMHAYKR